MEPACLRHTELPHTSKLFSDFLYRYHKVEPFYTSTPTCGYPENRRAAIVEALREQNPDSPALERLAQEGALAVVTGQQVGLFSGPAYTIYKALTAAKLAREMSAHGQEVVPIFWLATEDHDFPEVAHTWSYDREHQPVRLEVDAPRGEGQPAGTVSVEHWPVEKLRELLKDQPWGDEVCRLVEEAYTPGATMGAAFHSLLKRLLEPYDFLFLDPMRSSIRELAAPMLRKALSMSPDLIKLLLQRNRELEVAGYHAQVHVDARTSLFFVLENGRRIALRDSSLSSSDLQARAHQISPNALLRPVVQDYLLPTAAYVGGPAEIAYFAQSQVLYERLLGRMPRVVSRSGFTLADGRTAKIMDRFELALPDFFGGSEHLRERIAGRLVPTSLDGEFEQATDLTNAIVEKLKDSLDGFDPTLSAAMGKSGSKIAYQLSKIRGKVSRELLRRDQRSQGESAYAYGSLYPNKHLQERLYGILPFLAQHGPDLIGTLYENVRLDCPDHILLPLT